MGRCAAATRTPRTSVGRPCPCPPMSSSVAVCRMCCPRGSTKSATMGCGVLSIVPACSRGTRGGHHEPQSHCVASPCRPHRSRRFPEPWPPTTRVPSSWTPWPEARFSLTLRLSDPTRHPGPHPSAHLSESQRPPESSHERASQQAQAVLKCQTGGSCASVQQSFCVGSAPQKLSFVRCTTERRSHPMQSVCICGSFRFYEEMIQLRNTLQARGVRCG